MNHSNQLSRHGEARREAMLDGLLGEMASLQRRRRTRRRAVALGVMSILAACIIVPALVVTRDRSTPNVVVNGTDRPSHVVAIQRPAAGIQIVVTDPTVLDRFAPAADSRSSVVMIDDESLLRALSTELHIESGLIRIGDEARLTVALNEHSDDDVRHPL